MVNVITSSEINLKKYVKELGYLPQNDTLSAAIGDDSLARLNRQANV